MKALTLNIGLNVGRTNKQNSVAATVDACERHGFVVHGALRLPKGTILPSNKTLGEDTLVVACQAPRNNKTKIYILSTELNQEAIAAKQGHAGFIVGPAANTWGKFDPKFFATWPFAKSEAVRANGAKGGRPAFEWLVITTGRSLNTYTVWAKHKTEAAAIKLVRDMFRNGAEGHTLIINIADRAKYGV